MSGIELTFLSLLGAAVVGVLARVVLLHLRIARRARELESELQPVGLSVTTTHCEEPVPLE